MCAHGGVGSEIERCSKSCAPVVDARRRVIGESCARMVDGSSKFKHPKAPLSKSSCYCYCKCKCYCYCYWYWYWYWYWY